MSNQIDVRALYVAVIVAAQLSIAACGGGGGGGNYGGGNSGGACGGAYAAPCSAGSPTVTLNAIASPVNRTVTLTAVPAAPNGVMRVDFLVDNSVIGMATAAPFTTSWNTSGLTDGAHTVAARVTDTQNLTANSSAASVTVTNNLSLDLAMAPGEEFPVPVSTATGTGQLAVNLLTGAVSGNFTLTGLTATVAHIHDAYAGNAGGILVAFAPHATIANRWDLPAGSTLTATQIDRLMAGALYVNAHSTAYPAGEVRAQLKPSNIRVAYSNMSGAQEVPPVTITASGVAAVTVDTAANEASVHVNSTGVDDAIMAHIHRGAVGVNGNIFFDLTKDTTSVPARPGHWFVERRALAAADVSDFNNNGWYANMHTPAFQTGAIRGQVTPPVVAATLTQLQSSIFGPRCATCHTGGGASLPAAMNLTSVASTYAALVGVPSTEVNTLMRVAAGSSATSYIINKLEGTQTIGGRMPAGGPFLDQPTIDTVKSWINAGALNN